MAAASKVKWSQLKVGILALSALLILAVLIFLLTSTGGIFERYATLRTYMDDASGITEGAVVRLNGISVGDIQKIRLSGSRNPKRAVEIRMEVKQEYLPQIPVDSRTEISASNLLGEKFINITKGKSPQHVQPGSELPSVEAQDIPELMAASANLLQTLQNIVNRADRMLAGIDAGNGNLGKLLKDNELYNRLNSIAAEGQQLLGDIRNGKGTLSRLIYDDALYQDIRAPLKRLDAVLADLQHGQGTAGRLLHDPKLYDDAQKSLAEIRGMLSDVNAGKGTAGKLLKDDALYKQLDELVGKLDTTIDKLNSGQGTLGQLMVNPQLYNSLSGTMREFQSLAKDMRANPKKFLRIQLKIF
jgi:phospholipid/cholesterol/gamma-HCH transport system substrate-binding protein